MRETFRLGRIAGIRIGVNWSVLGIFALITYGLAARYLPSAYPGRGIAAYTGTGLAVAVVFVLSLLAHEVSHAVVARRNGVAVEGITLWLFGGVARLAGPAPSPAAEVRLAGVGPLVSLVLGAGFIAIAAVIAAAGVAGLPLAAVGWLGAVNVSLAVFNVIPAAPLDGGRLLRALVWWRTGDRRKATVFASRAGQVFGWILVAGGLAWLFTARSLSGLWLSLIGWFLISAATTEGRQAAAQAAREALARIPAGRVMSSPVITAPASATVDDFLSRQLGAREHSAFPVTDHGGRTVGLVTLNQIGKIPAADRARVTLAQAACPLDQVPSCRAAEPLSDVAGRLDSGRGAGRALVFEDGHLAGIISASDITRALRWSGIMGDDDTDT